VLQIINKMNKDKKKNTELLNRLNSSNYFVIIEALREIKEYGNINIIPHLFDLINENTPDIIKKNILRLICDIKEQSAAPILIDAMAKRDFGDDTSEVVAIFWQSRLDFSNYLPTFIRIFIKEDYQTALEAFTVVEGSVPKITDEMQQKCINMLQSAVSSISKDKKPLFDELIKVIKGEFF
jgi:hypothetical protein